VLLFFKRRSGSGNMMSVRQIRQASPPQVNAWYRVPEFPGLRIAVGEDGAAWIFLHEIPDGPYVNLKALLFYWGLEGRELAHDAREDS
jgi:hypothetical protein